MTQPICHATLHDLSDMDRIEQEAFNTPWSRDLLRGAIYNMRYDVRVVRGEEDSVAGFYISHSVHRNNNLDNLAVDHDRRRRGFGRTLLMDWMGRAADNGHTQLTLQVNTENESAQGLYREHGFRVKRLLKAYYTNGEDAYEMVRAIDTETSDWLANGVPIPDQSIPRTIAWRAT